MKQKNEKMVADLEEYSIPRLIAYFVRLFKIQEYAECEKIRNIIAKKEQCF